MLLREAEHFLEEVALPVGADAVGKHGFDSADGIERFARRSDAGSAAAASTLLGSWRGLFPTRSELAKTGPPDGVGSRKNHSSPCAPFDSLRAGSMTERSRRRGAPTESGQAPGAEGFLAYFTREVRQQIPRFARDDA